MGPSLNIVSFNTMRCPVWYEHLSLSAALFGLPSALANIMSFPISTTLPYSDSSEGQLDTLYATFRRVESSQRSKYVPEGKQDQD